MAFQKFEKTEISPVTLENILDKAIALRAKAPAEVKALLSSMVIYPGQKSVKFYQNVSDVILYGLTDGKAGNHPYWQSLTALKAIISDKAQATETRLKYLAVLLAYPDANRAAEFEGWLVDRFALDGKFLPLEDVKKLVKTDEAKLALKIKPAEKPVVNAVSPLDMLRNQAKSYGLTIADDKTAKLTDLATAIELHELQLADNVEAMPTTPKSNRQNKK